jgi:hypothetical protein
MKKIAVIAALSATALAGPALATTLTPHTVATFRQVTNAKNVAPKTLAYVNQDVVKTTSVTTKTPIYQTVTVPVYQTVKTPVYDAKGKLTGYKTTQVQTGTTTQQRLAGYNTVVTKSTAVTPKSTVLTTNGSNTTLAATPVVFNYVGNIYSSHAAQLGGDQSALFTLKASSTSAPTQDGAFFTQLFGPGSLSFIRTTPIAGKSNLLSVVFDSLTLTAPVGGTQFWLNAHTPANAIAYSSDFVRFNFDGIVNPFEFSLLGYGAGPFAIASLDPTLTNVTGARSLNSFRGNTQGALAAGMVPEPATWALMLLGFGAVAGAMRQRRRSALQPAI